MKTRKVLIEFCFAMFDPIFSVKFAKTDPESIAFLKWKAGAGVTERKAKGYNLGFNSIENLMRFVASVGYGEMIAGVYVPVKFMALHTVLPCLYLMDSRNKFPPDLLVCSKERSILRDSLYMKLDLMGLGHLGTQHKRYVTFTDEEEVFLALNSVNVREYEVPGLIPEISDLAITESEFHTYFKTRTIWPGNSRTSIKLKVAQ